MDLDLDPDRVFHSEIWTRVKTTENLYRLILNMRRTIQEIGDIIVSVIRSYRADRQTGMTGLASF